MSAQRPSVRLAELGLNLPPVATPVAAYVPAVRVPIFRGAPGIEGHDQAWVSGQLPFIDGSLPLTGLVGEAVSLSDARELATRAALNAIAAAADLTGDINRIHRVLKVTGYVASAPGFTEQPKVVDGASELLGAVFAAAGRHARSAVGVAALPLGSPVEIEVVFEIALPHSGAL